MGSITAKEGITILAMPSTMTLWIGERWFLCDAVTAALVGVSALLVTKVLSWDECLSKKNAWNTMAWFGILIGMATQLRNLGVIGVFSYCVAGGVGSLAFRERRVGAKTTPMYFGEDYVSLRKWLTVGFPVSVVNIMVWIVVGGV